MNVSVTQHRLTGVAAIRPKPAGGRLATVRRLAIAIAVRAAGFALLVAIWAAASTQFLAVQLPRPELVLQALSDNLITAPSLSLQGLQGGYLSNVGYTVANTLVAGLVGGSVGFFVGAASARVQVVRNASSPVLLLFGTVPDLVLAPFLLIWIGPGRAAQFVIVAFFCFVILAISTQNAALRLPTRYEESAATLGAGPAHRFRTIVLPATIPAIIGAARIALGTAWGLQCAGELLGSERGVGRVVVLSQQLSFTAGTIAVILLLGAVAVAVDTALVLALRTLCRWSAGEGA
ncbi:MAG: binding--dependent transport system inner rane component family protein [Solirubrobacterales bacterium]|nr:binding--dependent transport system inner rane component family protein [Solirubrobacterales bacterium]